jgi:hypothetical protein
VAADSSAPQAYRDAATVREVALNFDKLPPQQVIDRLKPLAVPGNPGSAARANWWPGLSQAGHADLAGPLFAAIAKDKDVPDTIAPRAPGCRQPGRRCGGRCCRADGQRPRPRAEPRSIGFAGIAHRRPPAAAGA